MRTLDIDLLALGDSVLPDAATQDRWRDLPPDAQAAAAPDRLILPHPRLQDRAFVLVPLADVAPDWVHPRLGLTVRADAGRPAADGSRRRDTALNLRRFARLSSLSDRAYIGHFHAQLPDWSVPWPA